MGWSFVGDGLLCCLCLVSLFYMCEFHMNPVCVVCVVTSD